MKKNIKIKLDSHWGSSLKRVLLDDSPMSVFVDSTVSEWFDAKHRITSEKEIQMLNSFEVNQCCFCNSTLIQKMVILRMDYKDINAKSVIKDSQ